ncbi:heparinase II/III family protein [Anaerohalosphaera lusitana]|nr:heparinase II/III family protein [Anaerohalosphaera lusitana]
MQDNKTEHLLNGKFSFVNCTHNIGWMPEWNCEYLPKLWQYNLHYFEWLWALEYEDAKAVVSDWIDSHKLARGQVGWEPYPVSLRLMNWCGVFFSKHRVDIESDGEFTERLWKSFFLQCQWLIKHLEVHLLGNHYFENAAALVFVGSCFEGQSAKKWLDCGLGILHEQIPEQILPDGMHFELSPMYHSRMVYLLAILAATKNRLITELVEEPLERMVDALKKICHPDGQIALLNDSALGIYNEPDQLIEYCGKLLDRDFSQEQCGNFELPNAGYYGWRDKDDNYVICDAGNIGPDYIPGHAHADIFNFELSLGGQRVIIDSGVYDYVESDERRYCRSTAAHNTVEINGLDQCECWGAFRVARRGYPRDIKFQADENGFVLSGNHSGYERVPGGPIHHRAVHWHESGRLKICDRITSKRPVHSISHMHLHSECEIVSFNDHEIIVSYPAGQFLINMSKQSVVSIVNSHYCPRFGIKLKSNVICMTSEGSDIRLAYSLMNMD